MVRGVVTRCLIGLLALATVALPIGYYRYEYTKMKRVRVVTEGKVYRSGQLTAAGFTQTIKRYGIKTIMNLQDEDADPSLDRGLTESQFCKQMGVNYVYLPPALTTEGEPDTIEKFLAVCDDLNAYPILIHCKAGLHRTGTMAAFYRIEYEGWTPQAAMRELMTNGFTLKQCQVKNPYIKNYLVDYVPRAQRGIRQGVAIRGDSAPAMILLDRYLLKNFVKAWLICFVSLVSLYVIIDAFSHFEELLIAARHLQKSISETVAIYYGYQLVLIFDRLCSVILLLAATFTIAWLQRQNELVPLLSSGVPIGRILRPIYIGSIFFLLLQTINREVLMPHLAEQLELGADDPTGRKSKSISGGFDANGILLEGGKAIPSEKVITGMNCTVPTHLGGTMYHVHAREARFIPAGTMLPDGTRHTSSGWLLSNTTASPELPAEGLGSVLIPINTGQTFVKVVQMDFRRMTREKSWYQFARLTEILSEMDAVGAQQLPCLATQLHQRLAAPLITLVTIALGLGIILRQSSKNIFLNTGLCLAAAASIFLCTMVGKYLGDREYLSTALAGWLPIILFGPLAITMRDGMQS